MKTIRIFNGDTGKSLAIGPFVPFAYHQHYSKGPRYYDPNCIPSVSYGQPTTHSLLPDKAYQTHGEALVVLRKHTTRRALGKHGQRGINRIVPDDFPTSEDLWGWNPVYCSVAEWTVKSEYSHYNSDNH